MYEFCDEFQTHREGHALMRRRWLPGTSGCCSSGSCRAPQTALLPSQTPLELCEAALVKDAVVQSSCVDLTALNICGLETDNHNLSNGTKEIAEYIVYGYDMSSGRRGGGRLHLSNGLCGRASHGPRHGENGVLKLAHNCHHGRVLAGL